MRLIDADTAKSKAIICTNAVIFGDESEAMFTFASTLQNLLIMAFDEAPTVEAEPVRHGRWIENPTEYYKEWIKVFGNDRFFAECEYFTDHIACSNCLKTYNYIDNDSTDEWNYCPNCGAKMDGDPDV